MVEKVITRKEDIVITLKELNESQTKSDSPMSLSNLDQKGVIEKSVELVEIGRMRKPKIVEFGGLRGGAEKIIKEQNPGKEFEYVNLEYSKEQLGKSPGYRLLSDMTYASIKGNSVDVVLIENLWFGTDSLRQKVEKCPAGTEGKEELIQLLDCMSKLQSRLAYLEGVRILQKGGRLAWGGIAEEEEFNHMNSSKDFTGTGNLKFLNGVYNEIGKGRRVIAFVYEKTDNKPLEKALSEERRELDMLFEELKTYEAKGGLMYRMREEGNL